MDLPTFSTSHKAEKSLDLSKVLLFGPSLIAVVVSALIVFFVVWPKYGEVQQLKISNKTLEESAVRLETKASDLKSLDRDRLTSQLKSAEILLPSEKEIFKFIRQIENVRNTSGVVISSLSVGSVGQFSTGSAPAGGESDATGAAAPVPPPTTALAGAELGDVNQVTMKVVLSSDFDQMFKFLNELYALPRVTTVGGLSFSIDQSGLIGTNMDINSLWQERPTELPSIETALPKLTSVEEELLAKIESGITVAAPVEVPDVPRGKTNIFAAN